GEFPFWCKKRCTSLHLSVQRRRENALNWCAHSFEEESAMQSRIVGTTLPVLEFTLEPNEAVISEAGELSWMSSSIQMQTHTQFGGGGGFFGALKRVAGGGSLFMTEYRAMG